MHTEEIRRGHTLLSYGNLSYTRSYPLILKQEKLIIHVRDDLVKRRHRQAREYKVTVDNVLWDMRHSFSLIKKES